jgi:hypothetical protein
MAKKRLGLGISCMVLIFGQTLVGYEPYGGDVDDGDSGGNRISAELVEKGGIA